MTQQFIYDVRHLSIGNLKQGAKLPLQHTLGMLPTPHCGK